MKSSCALCGTRHDVYVCAECTERFAASLEGRKPLIPELAEGDPQSVRYECGCSYAGHNTGRSCPAHPAYPVVAAESGKADPADLPARLEALAQQIERLRADVQVIADEASAYLKAMPVTATPSWLLKLYGLSVDRQPTEPKKPWGQRDRQA